MERLIRDAVPLDMCLPSNVGLGIFGSMEEHPFPKLWRAGLNVNVNSDDPPFFSTTLTDEVRDAAQLAYLTRADVADLHRRPRGLRSLRPTWETSLSPRSTAGRSTVVPEVEQPSPRPATRVVTPQPELNAKRRGGPPPPRASASPRGRP